MTLNDFFIGDTLTLNWDYIWTLPYFCEMDKTEQNPRWHSEGTAKEHTILVVNNMFKQVEGDNFEVGYSLHKRRLLILAALFHDVGKPNTTFKGKDDNWHSYGHENVGEKLARRMLWDWDIKDREFICHLVKYHMSPLFVFKQNDPDTAIKRMMSSVDWVSLERLKMCDLLGAIQDPEFSTKEQDKQIIEAFGKRCFDIDYDKKFTTSMVDQLGVGEFSLCDDDVSIKNFRVKEKKGTLHVMIGLPGSGKNTYLAEKIATSEIPASALILSRDDIRVELGFCTEDEKIVGTDAQEKAVTKLFNERLNEAIKVGRDIVVNNINLSEKRRKALKNQCPNYEVVYWYVEAPTLSDNLRRREGQIEGKVFDNMISNFDFPQLFECNILNIFKQSKEDEL